jgi:hypothetical protein
MENEPKTEIELSEESAAEFETEQRLKAARVRHTVEAATGALGVVSGAGLGALAGGPVGAVAGAVIGAVMGAASGWAADGAVEEQNQLDEEFDSTIGVAGGPIGSPNLQHPPVKVGAFSAESSGAGGEAGPVAPADANGPISPPTK